jgi:DNA-binding NtrC family response regulator
LAEHFLEQQAVLYQESSKTLSPDAIAALVAYDWPGNVRELANAIEHAYVLSPNPVMTAQNLPEIVRLALQQGIEALDDEIVPLETAERALIAKALRVANGHQGRAAKMLHIERHRLYRKIRRYGLQNLTRPE